MVCGYTEPDHDVVEAHEINPTKSGGRQVSERCRPRQQQSWMPPGTLAKLPDYIRIRQFNQAGRLVSRNLLLFEGADVRDIEKAWELVTGPASVAWKDVPFTERVWGDTGYTKDGTVIMY